MLKFQLGWPLIAHFVGLSNPGKQWMRNLPKVCADGVWNFQLGWPSNPVMGIGMYQAMVMIGIKLATCKLKLVGHQLSFLKSTDLYTVEKHGGVASWTSAIREIQHPECRLIALLVHDLYSPSWNYTISKPDINIEARWFQYNKKAMHCYFNRNPFPPKKQAAEQGPGVNRFMS